MVSCCLCDDDFNTLTCLLHGDALGKVGEMGCSMENRHEAQTHHLHLKLNVYPECQNKALKWVIVTASMILAYSSEHQGVCTGL
jgi:hypothetical protein